MAASGQTHSAYAGAWCADVPTSADVTGVALPALSIICVNWNSVDYLRECIESIYEHAPSLSFEIIVVDNASPEGGVDCLQTRFPGVTIAKSDRNLGFAAANNLGFRYSKGQYILLLNPDTRIIGSAIDLMLTQLRAVQDAGMVGGTLLNSDLSVSTTSIQKFPTILNQLLTVEWLRIRFPGLSLWDLSPLFSATGEPVAVDVIPGACMMVKRDVFERAGLMTEDYFMYAEDIDLNYKIARLGFSRYYVPQAHIVHHGGRSSAQREMSQWSTVMIQRAMLRYFRMSHGRLYASLYRVAMGGMALVRLLVLNMMLPLVGRARVQWSIAKWRVILNWALGVSQITVA
jgi:GT2 family glycosyltransferase